MQPRISDNTSGPRVVPNRFLDSDGRLIPLSVSTQLITLLQDDNTFPDGRYKKKDLSIALTKNPGQSPVTVNYDVIKLNGQFFAVFLGKEYALGKGSSGQVKFLQSLTDARWYAVKIIPERKVFPAEFHREIENLQIAGMGTGGFFRMSPSKGGQYVIVMQYAPGIPLHKLINNPDVHLNQVDWLTICKGVLTSLADLHKKGLFHFDIKLDNFIYDPETKQVRLVDLGAAVRIKDGKGHVLTDVVPPNAAPECEQPIPPDRTTAEVDYIVTYHSESYSVAETILSLITKGSDIDKSKISDPRIRMEIQNLLARMSNPDNPEDRPAIDFAIQTIETQLQHARRFVLTKPNPLSQQGHFASVKIGTRNCDTSTSATRSDMPLISPAARKKE